MSNFKIWWNLNVKALSGLYSHCSSEPDHYGWFYIEQVWDVESVADLTYQIGYEDGFLEARKAGK